MIRAGVWLNVLSIFVFSLYVYFVMPLVFGIYGRTATKLNHARNRGISIKKQLFGVSHLVRYTGMIGMTFFFPFLVCRKGPPVKIALVGSAIWLVLLEVFFVVIWPSL